MEILNTKNGIEIVGKTVVNTKSFSLNDIERVYQIIEKYDIRTSDSLSCYRDDNDKKRDLFEEYGISNLCQIAVEKAFNPFISIRIPKDEFIRRVEKAMHEIFRSNGRFKTAKKYNLSRPDLFKYYNISYEAFAYVEQLLRAKGINPETAWGIDYTYSINPNNIMKAWFAQGCRIGDKFKYYVNAYVNYLNKHKDTKFFRMKTPRKDESIKEYIGRLQVENLKYRFDLSTLKVHNNDIICTLSIGDKKRIEKLKSSYAKYYALEYCIEHKPEDATLRSDNTYVSITQLNWNKLNNWLKLSKKEKAKDLPLELAWELLFNRYHPIGLSQHDVNPIPLLDKVTKKTFMETMKIVKNESDGKSALKANTKSAYHLSIIFRDLQTLKRWVNKVAGEFNAINIHDAFVDAKHFMNLANRAGWIKMMVQFPDLRWKAHHFKNFEDEFNRLSNGKREFVEYSDSLLFENVRDKDVAYIGGMYDISQDEFEDYQEFFETTPVKKSTMLPYVDLSIGDYRFTKLDDDSKVGPFLGLATDCCQHLHNTASSCAEAGYRDSESGFYVVYKGDTIIAQSWAWRGKDNALCFDSIEALRRINIDTVAELYKLASKELIGKLGISRITVGDTTYGITKEIQKALNGVSCKSSKMIKDVEYTDAHSQWLLCE